MNSSVELNRLSNLLRLVERGKKISSYDIKWALAYVEQLKNKTRMDRQRKFTNTDDD